MITIGAGLWALPKVPVGVTIKADSNWMEFSEEVLASHKGKNVFVNFTADWCLTCKVNESVVFARKDVLDYLRANNVVLMKGDWTHRNSEITSFLNRYRRAGVPFYIAFGPGAPEGKILPELLTPDLFFKRLDEVIQQGGSH
jgi:thiol:disulfide interchange protein